MNNLRAVIFDMDGLLLDSERICLEAFVSACREYRFEPDVSVYYQCLGTTFPRAQEILKNGYGKDFPAEAVIGLWRRKYDRETLEKPVPLKKGVLSLLRRLDSRGLKRAVVTSTHRELALRKLSLSGILPFFEFLLCGDEIVIGKPHPEIYLQACRRLQEAPAACLALEDSDNGVLSAFQAGLRVIQVPDLLEPSPGVRALGHQVLASLEEVEKLLFSP